MGPIAGTLLTILILAGLGVCVVFGIKSYLTQSPGTLGLVDGRLRACPDSPNCVCSEDSRPDHHIEPLATGDDPAAAWQRLREALAAEPRSRVLTDEEHYLHAEVRSLIFRFVDDVECRLDAPAGVIHIRSASRAGYSDLGVNAARVERLRRRVEAAAP